MTSVAPDLDFALALEAPAWLWLLAPFTLATWIAAFARAGRHRGDARLAVAPAIAQSLAAGLAILALARPVRVVETRPVSAVALIDVSASVSDRELGRARALVARLARLARAAAPPHELRVVRFAAEPAEVALPAHAPASASRAGSDAADVPGIDRFTGRAALDTDIARALRLSRTLGDPTSTRRVLLVSDGRPTRGDALSEGSRLAGLGMRIDHVALDEHPDPAAGPGDVAIASLAAPDDVHPHEELQLQIRVASDRAARVRITLARDGHELASGVPSSAGDGATRAPSAGTAPASARSPGSDAARRPREHGSESATGGGGLTREITAGLTTVAWSTRVEGGDRPSIFTARVQRLDGPDAHPENDRGVLAIAPVSPPRALILAPTPTDASALAEALRAQSFEVTLAAPPPRFGPGSGPGSGPGDIGRADVIVLADLSRAELSEAALEALATAVGDGTGLLVTGGPHSFGPGGWAGSRLEPLLPVRLDAPGRRDEPTLALALVIDRSGSMSGARMDLTKQAARATADLLPPEDQIAVIAFDTRATTVVPLQPAANRLRIATDIGRIQTSGGTNILAGLREAVDQLSDTRARTKHVILISDGQSPNEGIAELVDAAAGSRITISTVGVGDGVDEGLLQLIASHGGGRYYHTRDPGSIPRIFSRETGAVAATGIVERPVTAVARRRRPSPMLAGIPVERAPLLGGYVRTRARPGADVLLATDGGDPLLARWAVGLGQVAAWTSDLGPRWAGTWARWPAFPKLWSQVARTIMRSRPTERFPMATRCERGVAIASVDAIGSDGHFLAGLDAIIEITEVGPEGAVTRGPPRRAAMLEIAPGRYEARLPVSSEAEAEAEADGNANANANADHRHPPGALILRAVLSRSGVAVGHAEGGLSVPLAPDLSPSPEPSSAAANDDGPSGAALLAALSAQTGGRALATPEDLFAGADPQRSRVPLRTPLLISAAVLSVVEVALRRLGGNPRAPTRRRG